MEQHDDLSPLAPPNEIGPDRFPDLGTLSPAFLYRSIPVPDQELGPPEYVYLRPPEGRSLHGQRVKFDVALTGWNSMWEAGPFTPQAVDRKRFPKALRWLLKIEDRNLRLVPRIPRHRYHAQAPLYHLLPASALKRAGLPLLKRGIWPYWSGKHGLDAHLPADFDDRLAVAFSEHIWPLLNDRSASYSFSDNDPIKILSHHLDFWLPYVDVVAQRRMKLNGRCKVEDDDTTFDVDVAQFDETNSGLGVRLRRPWRGGQLWVGEDEAAEALEELVEVADEHGALRSIIDAVKSHRVQDDFSDIWSYEREDFERRMYRKRSKVKVVFVELPDTTPVYSEDTEVHEHLLWGDFLTLLDARERRVAVCLRRGSIGAVNIAKELGYANHSPVSKALARIRQKASTFFEHN